MRDILSFLSENPAFSFVVAVLDIIIVRSALVRLSLFVNRHLNEAAGGRTGSKSLYRRCAAAAEKSFKRFENRKGGSGFYLKIKDRVKKSGYRGEYAPVIYILLKYVAPFTVFLISFIINFPDVIRPAATAALVFCTVGYVMRRRKRRITMKFNRYIYKIYKYLHNQISSGIKPTDAIKTVYLIVEDRELCDILTQLAARYELTLDIDEALKEFQSNFDIQEAETLCVALKQGVETGDNQDLLARQEQFMFNRYFNYIQAETDSCRLRGTLSVLMFAAIMVIMIAVPLFKDVVDATARIFLN